MYHAQMWLVICGEYHHRSLNYGTVSDETPKKPCFPRQGAGREREEREREAERERVREIVASPRAPTEKETQKGIRRK